VSVTEPSNAVHIEMSKQTEGPWLVLWCKSPSRVLWLVGWFGSWHSHVGGPFLSCSAALIATAGVRSTIVTRHARGLILTTMGCSHTINMLLLLWLLEYGNYAVYIIYIMWHIWRPRQEVNSAYWHYWQVFNSASNAVSKCAILS